MAEQMHFWSLVQQKERSFQRAAICHNHVCYAYVTHCNCVCHYLIPMPCCWYNWNSIDIKNETGNSSPASCSKVKQLEMPIEKSSFVFIFKNVCLQLWWKNPKLPGAGLSVIAAAAVLYHSRTPRADQSAELPVPAGNSCCPSSSPSPWMRQKPEDEQSRAGKRRQACRAKTCTVPSLTKWHVQLPASCTVTKGIPEVVDNLCPGSLTHTAMWKEKNCCKMKKRTS